MHVRLCVTSLCQDRVLFVEIASLGCFSVVVSRLQGTRMNARLMFCEYAKALLLYRNACTRI